MQLNRKKQITLIRATYQDHELERPGVIINFVLFLLTPNNYMPTNFGSRTKRENSTFLGHSGKDNIR